MLHYWSIITLPVDYYITGCNTHLAVDIRLVALIVLGYLSTEFERERNEDSVKYVMALEKSANLEKNKCMDNRRGFFSQNDPFTGVYRPALGSMTKGGGYPKSKKIA